MQPNHALYAIARSIPRFPPALEFPSGQLTADDQPLDLAGALVDLAHARVAVQLLDREVLEVAVAAVDLDGLRAHPLGHLGGVELGHRRLAPVGAARVLEEGGVPGHLPRGLD